MSPLADHLAHECQVDALSLYPIILIVCWLPNLVISTVNNYGYVYTGNAFIVLEILSGQTGTLTAIVFFYKSKEARRRWNKLLSTALPCMFSTPLISPTTGSSSDISDDFPLDTQLYSVRRRERNTAGATSVYTTRNSDVSERESSLFVPRFIGRISGSSGGSANRVHSLGGGLFNAPFASSGSQNTSGEPRPPSTSGLT